MPEDFVDAIRVTLSSPVNVDSLFSLPSNGTIQFCGFAPKPQLTEMDFRRLGEFIEDRPDVELRAYGLGADDDLEFLQFFPCLRRFSVDYSYSLTKLDGVRHLPAELKTLSFGLTKKTVSLKFLERFKKLQRLWLEGHTKDISSLSSLSLLEHLSIRSITLPDLSVFLPLKMLSVFEIKLGGTKNLGLLPQIGRIRCFELYHVRGLVDLSPISEMEFLEYLFLDTLNRVHCLPSMKQLTHLKRVDLNNLKSVTDLSPLLDAVNLEEAAVTDSKHLDPSSFECLKNHPSLKRLSAFVCRTKANETIKAMFGLPEVSCRPQFLLQDW